MNREEILHRLKALPYNPEEYWIMERAGLVMRGLADSAGGICLGCLSELADVLEADGVRRKDDGKLKGQRIFKIGKDIVIHENRLYGGFDVIDGYMVITEEGQRTLEYQRLLDMGFDPDKMKEYRTEHFVLHYQEGSPAEKDILEISDRKEKCFRVICDTLKVEPDYPAQYYLFSSAANLNRNTDRMLYGFFHSPDMVCEVYSEHIKINDYHEMTHWIAWQIGNPASNAIHEGTAVWFEHKFLGVDGNAWVKWFIDTGRYIKISDLMNNEYFIKKSGNVTYPLMGAFTGWLIDTYGMDKYLEFYRYRDCSEGLFSAYGKSLEELERLFVYFVKGYCMSDEVKEKLRKELYEFGLNLDGSRTGEYIAVVHLPDWK